MDYIKDIIWGAWALFVIVGSISLLTLPILIGAFTGYPLTGVLVNLGIAFIFLLQDMGHKVRRTK